MIFSKEGVRPDQEKVDYLQYLTPLSDKSKLESFLCMMQSNASFIPQFAKKSAVLTELTKGRAHFKWETKHQECFAQLITDFKKDTTLYYFDLNKQTFLITNAHKTGFGAILTQGDNESTAKATAIASRSTSLAEQQYPQIDLESRGVDYRLSRFNNYLVGSHDVNVVVTDHKLRHQDIDFKVFNNQSDYLSHAKPYTKMTEEEQ